jgi:ABC-type sugar transport system permease subunit
MDAFERALDAGGPRRQSGVTPYLLMIPGFLVVAILATGMVVMFDASFRELDRSTFRPAAEYSLHNYAKILEYKFFCCPSGGGFMLARS